MTTQLDLFATPAVGAHRKRAVRSEVEAAASCDAQRQRDQIVRLLSSTVHGWTADELAASMRPQVHRSTVASRLAQLRRDGLVEPFGFRASPTQRNVQVWYPKTQARTVDVETGERL